MQELEKIRALVREEKIKEQEYKICVITITSGKGGVGKTNLTVNLALALSEANKKVIIFDADLGMANANIVLGINPSPRYNLSDVIKGEKTLQEIIVEGPDGVSLISGGVGIMKVVNISAKKRKEIIESLFNLGKIADYLLIDTSPGLSSSVLSFITAAEIVILITTPEPPAISSAYALIKNAINKNKDINLKIVINRIRSLTEGKMTAERLIEICKNFLGTTIESLGYIYEDESVRQAVDKQKPFLLSFPKSKASACIQQIRNRILQIPPQKRGFWDFLKKIFE